VEHQQVDATFATEAKRLLEHSVGLAKSMSEALLSIGLPPVLIVVGSRAERTTQHKGWQRHL
jgi:hypothetical protein